MFPKLKMNNFIEVLSNKEMRFFLNDEFEQFHGIIHPDEDYEFKEEDITEVWRQVDNDTFKCIYRKSKPDHIKEWFDEVLIMLYVEDFNIAVINDNGHFARIEELNKMVEHGAITINREKLEE